MARDVYVEVEIDLSNLPKDARKDQLKERIKEIKEAVEELEADRLDLRIKE